MTITCDFAAVLPALCKTVQRYGWRLAEGPNLASKTFDTVCGERDAILWMRPSSADPRFPFCLTAQFLSEGRNVVSASFGRVPASACADRLEAALAPFFAEVEGNIADSYGVRLRRAGIA